MISVIVPIYNVEPYLRQCLDSILAQTYNDIEIILVDDGSTDGCPAICDEYQEKDDRIVVFHTENRGLSAARNLGIDNAHGEWLMFVDSDDWVEPVFCELPLQMALEERADLVIFGLIVFDESGVITIKEIGHKGIIPAQTAIDFGKNAAWNKLYRITLFDGIRYPEGMFFEDVATTHRLIYRAEQIAAMDIVLYHYRKRERSISSRNDSKKIRDHYLAHLIRYDAMLSCDYPKDKLELHILECSLRYLIHVEPSDDPVYLRAERITSSYCNDLEVSNAYLRNAYKIWKLNKSLFHTYYRDRGCKTVETINESI